MAAAALREIACAGSPFGSSLAGRGMLGSKESVISRFVLSPVAFGMGRRRCKQVGRGVQESAEGSAGWPLELSPLTPGIRRSSRTRAPGEEGAVGLFWAPLAEE